MHRRTAKMHHFRVIYAQVCTADRQKRIIFASFTPKFAPQDGIKPLQPAPHCGGRHIIIGKMAEWSIATVLKTAEGHTSGGSNPSLSAESCKSPTYSFLRIRKRGMRTPGSSSPPRRFRSAAQKESLSFRRKAAPTAAFFRPACCKRHKSSPGNLRNSS